MVLAFSSDSYKHFEKLQGARDKWRVYPDKLLCIRTKKGTEVLVARQVFQVELAGKEVEIANKIGRMLKWPPSSRDCVEFQVIDGAHGFGYSRGV